MPTGDTPHATERSTSWDLQDVVAGLRTARERWRTRQQRHHEFGGREFPSRDVLRQIVDRLRGVLFPMRLGPADLRQESEDFYIGHTLDAALNDLLHQVQLELRYARRLDTGDESIVEQRAIDIVRGFAQKLPVVRATLDTGFQASFDGDPAALSVDEVLLCYPGITALIHHRLAHQLYRSGAPLVARIIGELSHSETGIDHGTGVVIGETAVIGERVRVYQAVTLGAKHFPIDAHGKLQKGLPRHPIVEDDVVIYAGATILGRVTVGRGSTIGGNVWLTHGVPPGSHITQASSRHAPDGAPGSGVAAGAGLRTDADAASDTGVPAEPSALLTGTA